MWVSLRNNRIVCVFHSYPSMIERVRSSRQSMILQPSQMSAPPVQASRQVGRLQPRRHSKLLRGFLTGSIHLPKILMNFLIYLMSSFCSNGCKKKSRFKHRCFAYVIRGAQYVGEKLSLHCFFTSRVA